MIVIVPDDPRTIVKYVFKHARTTYQWQFAARCLSKGRVSQAQLRILRGWYVQLKRQQRKFVVVPTTKIWFDL